MSGVAGQDLDALLGALAAELARAGVERVEICIVGGTALSMLGIVDRPTKDVDVVAVAESDGWGPIRLRKAEPLPPVLQGAVERVAEQLGIARDWLNAGPADLMDHGLPVGFEERLTCVEYGTTLSVHVASRLDQICLKTHAATDSAGRHLSDLAALAPTPEEMAFAFEWVLTQDPSDAFRTQLSELADHLGVSDVLARVKG